MPTRAWEIDKLTNGDFEVKYPDNRCNGAPESEGLAYTDRAKPMSKSIEKKNPIVDILDYIQKTKGIELTNTQIYLLIEILG